MEELSSRTFRSLEEQLYIKKAQLKKQGRQHAAVLIPDQRVEFVKTPTLKDFLVKNRHLEEFKQQCFESAGFYKSPIEAEREIAELERQLLAPESIIVNHKAATGENDDYADLD